MINDYLDGVEPIGLQESDYVIHCNGRKWASVLGVWYRYDDNVVKEIKDVQLVSEFAYMLFYERRKSTE